MKTNNGWWLPSLVPSGDTSSTRKNGHGLRKKTRKLLPVCMKISFPKVEQLLPKIQLPDCCIHAAYINQQDSNNDMKSAR